VTSPASSSAASVVTRPSSIISAPRWKSMLRQASLEIVMWTSGG